MQIRYLRRTISAAESDGAVPCPDVGPWISAARPSGGKRATARSRSELQVLQPRQGVKEDFVYVYIL
jgi:hypothetical protein